MKLKYFKNYQGLQDCYVGETEGKYNFFKIVSITNDSLFLWANDEGSSFRDGRLDGLCRIMKVERLDFEKLQYLAGSKERKKGLEIIKKFHEGNPDKTPNSIIMEGDLENFNLEKMLEMYRNAKPILE